MKPIEHAACAVRAVEGRLRAFFTTSFADAGLGDVRVGLSPTDDGFVLLPYRVYPWPRVADTPTNVPLLGPARGDRPSAPDAWVQVGQLATPAVERAFLRADKTRTERVMTTVTLASLPAPLQRWYTAQAAIDPGWAPIDGTVRLPLIEWRPDFILRIGFLGFAPPGHRDSLVLPAVATVAVHQARTLDVSLPPRPADPGLPGLLRALGELLEPEAGARLTELSAALSAPMDTRFALLLQSEAPDTDLDPMLRALGAAAAPTVHLTVQLGVGGGPVLTAASTGASSVSRGAP